MAATALPPGRTTRIRLDGDAWAKRGFIAIIALYLVVALALPLYAMLSKAFSTFQFDLGRYEFQVSDAAGTFDGTIVTGAELNATAGVYAPEDLIAGSADRMPVAKLFADFSFRSPVRYKVRSTQDDGRLLIGSAVVMGGMILLTFLALAMAPKDDSTLGTMKALVFRCH